MKRLLIVLGLLLTFVGISAAPASADLNNGTCSIGGWNFSGYVQEHIDSSSVVHFDAWSVGYVQGTPKGLEWRVRAWDSVNTSNRLIYDTGYQTGSNTNRVSGNPGGLPLLPPGTRFIVNGGRLGDGFATCEVINLYINN